jgi:proline dehydrogenase
MNPDTRWSLPDLEKAVEWCSVRHGQGIHCTVATQAEYSNDRDQADAAVQNITASVRMIAARVPDCTISIKPTAMGILFDPREYERNLATVLHESEEHEIGIEIDMEGRDLVDATLQSALEMAGEYPLTVALQAYLDRTPGDCELCLDEGIRIRLVKGAYLGDTGNFVEIQRRLRALISRLGESGENFSVGTHDPEIVGWIQRESGIPPHQLELGFLMGLSDETKMQLAGAGWDVSEYVPFGANGTAYRKRRERYLALLREAGRSPLP